MVVLDNFHLISAVQATTAVKSLGEFWKTKFDILMWKAMWRIRNRDLNFALLHEFESNRWYIILGSENELNKGILPRSRNAVIGQVYPNS